MSSARCIECGAENCPVSDLLVAALPRPDADADARHEPAPSLENKGRAADTKTSNQGDGT